MEHRIIGLQALALLGILSFAPCCYGGFFDFLQTGSWNPRDAKSARIVAYEQEIHEQIERFREDLIGPKCSPMNLVNDPIYSSFCETMDESYCDGYIFKKCLGRCCQIPKNTNDTNKGCARPCDGQTFCQKTTDASKPELSHCEENSFTAVNLRPVITEMELEKLLNLPVIGE